MDKDIKTLHEELEAGSITSEELVKEAIKDAPITEAPGKYVRGKLINVTGIGDDNHLVKDINSELNEGLYITEEV